MKTIKPRKIALAGTVVAAVALVGCLGCAAQTQTADTGAAQEPVQQEQTEQQAAAPEKVAKKTLAEWVATYPNQGNSYMEAKMAHTFWRGGCSGGLRRLPRPRGLPNGL